MTVPCDAEFVFRVIKKQRLVYRFPLSATANPPWWPSPRSVRYTTDTAQDEINQDFTLGRIYHHVKLMFI